MTAYAEQLKSYLADSDATQEGLAALVGVKQVSIHRYSTGDRFPDSAIAKEIDKHTGGEVSFELWRKVALERLGLAA